MSEGNSPTYQWGTEDGQRDNERIGSCPPSEPVGKREPGGNPRIGTMYARGYDATFSESYRHTCTDKCQKGRENGKEKTD